jgi:hypothetical protein
MTPPLDELERLLSAATPGPWTAGGSVFDGERVTDQVWLWEETGHHPGDPDAPDTRMAVMPRADGELAAALRNNAERLVEIARLVHDWSAIKRRDEMLGSGPSLLCLSLERQLRAAGDSLAPSPREDTTPTEVK